ncbi:DNA polymerase protein [Rhizobium phage RHph_Y52]|nr:DNA polymerase protein [Rhizobium phage RHph_Y21]QIG76718.1 DNA polymerase protein [Rhizobium phage RHph_Y52]
MSEDRIEPYPQDVAFDLEVYSNCFTAIFVHILTGHRWIFEISDRVNQSVELFAFLYHMKHCGMRCVGFNNVGFDYPVLHEFLNIYAAQGVVYPMQLFAKSSSIIHSESRFGSIIWPRDRLIPQLDLYLIHHFDNPAKTTSLKALEINMRSHTVEDLPFNPNYPIDVNDIPKLIKYNAHDVAETIKFYMFSLPAIETRMSLVDRLGEDVINFNDTKIGKEFFIAELEKAKPGICFDRSTRKKVPRQTPRPNGIPLRDVIFPYVQFRHPELQRVLEYLKTITITNTKSAEELKDLNAVINGFRFDFGTGGIHGSIEKRIVRSDEDYIIVDADVASFYPNLAIKNGVYPAHLSELFCTVYSDLYDTRQKYPKKSATNLLYKLALNGVYGDSNNVYGPFLDPQYTMTITVNGQLLLCMCAEWVISECDAEMIQANTDGFTVRIPRSKRARYDEICKWWQDLTKLTLEFVDYESMFIRDVNSYIAKSTSGKIKRVGAYQYVTPVDVEAFKKTPERGWHQDHSAIVVQKAAEAAMLNGADIGQFIRSHTDAFDFMMRIKVPRSSKLCTVHARPAGAIGPPEGAVTQNICRYYVANTSTSLMKIMPPDKRKPDAERHFSVEAGWNVALCNSLDQWDWSTVNYDYYIEEAKKLVLTDDAKPAYQDLFAPVRIAA